MVMQVWVLSLGFVQWSCRFGFFCLVLFNGHVGLGSFAWVMRAIAAADVEPAAFEVAVTAVETAVFSRREEFVAIDIVA
jgi:hypothetical protein